MKTNDAVMGIIIAATFFTGILFLIGSALFLGQQADKKYAARCVAAGGTPVYLYRSENLCIRPGVMIDLSK